MSEMKNTLGGINNRSDTVETKMSKLKNITILPKMKHSVCGGTEKKSEQNITEL